MFQPHAWLILDRLFSLGKETRCEHHKINQSRKELLHALGEEPEYIEGNSSRSHKEQEKRSSSLSKNQQREERYEIDRINQPRLEERGQENGAYRERRILRAFPGIYPACWQASI